MSALWWLKLYLSMREIDHLDREPLADLPGQVSDRATVVSHVHAHSAGPQASVSGVPS